MKIGNHSFPRFRLPGLVEAVKRIYDSTQGGEVDPEVVAHILGQSPISGGFKQKLADLRTFGLLEGRGKVRVSDLGKKITYPTTDDEKNEVYIRVLKNVPLWETIYDKYDVRIPESNFWIEISKITGAESPESRTKEESIRKAYKEDVSYIKPVKKPMTPIPDEAIDRREPMEAQIKGVDMPLGQAPEGIEELKARGVRIWLPKADFKSAIRTAKKLLEIAEEDEPKEDNS